jgi:outer membrane murein-binding lipoprotein Lpp
MEYIKSIGTIFLFSLLIIGCSNKQSIDVAVNDIANIECRAMQLRNQRFKLADEIRFAQDTVIQLQHSGDTSVLHERLIKMYQQKELLHTRSSQLADSIKVQMDVIVTVFLSDKNKELYFNQKLDSILTIKGCK